MKPHFCRWPPLCNSFAALVAHRAGFGMFNEKQYLRKWRAALVALAALLAFALVAHWLGIEPPRR